MKIYKVTKWDNKKIEVFEIEKKTEKTIWVKKVFNNGTTRVDMERVTTEYYKYFDTFGDARKYLLDKISNSISSLNENITELKSELEIVFKMAEK